MKLPKGFGKNYFTLRAITVTSAQVTLLAQRFKVESFHLQSFKNDKETLEDEESPPTTLYVLQNFKKPCHCNCYYFRRTKKSLKLHPLQNLYKNYFKSLNNAISPPLLQVTLPKVFKKSNNRKIYENKNGFIINGMWRIGRSRY